jgi:hypothetical protein
MLEFKSFNATNINARIQRRCAAFRRFEHLLGHRPVNNSIIICPQHREARVSAQVQEGDAPRPSPGQAQNTQIIPS